MAIMAFSRLGPSVATMASARRKPGNASITSTRPLMARSSRRPPSPARSPSAVPASPPMATLMRPDPEADPAPVDDPGQEVPPELVGAEGMGADGGRRRWPTAMR